MSYWNDLQSNTGICINFNFYYTNNGLDSRFRGMTNGAGMKNNTFTRDLTIGSQGSDVTGLQNFLISKSYLGSGYNTGYFGSLTQKALIKVPNS